VKRRSAHSADGWQAQGRAWRCAGIAVSIFAAIPNADAQERDPAATGGPAGAVSQQSGTGAYQHLTARNSVGDILNHPAFRGFGRTILPWDDRAYDEAMPIANIGTLLPYHTQVDSQEVVSALNRMIDDADSGKQIFFDFYTEDQKQAEPAKANTGLFFVRGKVGAPFAIIAPGGGFSYVGSVHEGFPYAAAISREGYNAFVLKYRTGQGGAVATEDLAFALSYIIRNAATLDVSARDYSLWGSSAGARMAAAIGTHGTARFGGDPLPRPSTVIMAYTGHSDFGPAEPPTFVIVGERDGIAPPAMMEKRLAALRAVGAPVEYRKVSRLGHGFGPGTGTSAAGWIDDAVRFWERSISNKPLADAGAALTGGARSTPDAKE
jgi:acetyl esterase/lipase